ncbi:DVU3141 family protein [Marinobacterium aestuariivivens]|uniref:DVU3141 family protein n=1 Tax=Marinobacterium aestuariivivens TaxID=1698799 RepID=A0ABW1ZVK1_9GAMM
MALGLLTAIAVAGCSSSQPRGAYDASSYVGGEPLVTKGEALSSEVSEFLAQGAAQSTRFFASSYWGDNVEVTAQSPYYAASGRYCRELVVSKMTDEAPARWLACEGGSGQWVAVRALR